jgi:hypothetical protein
MPSSRAGRVPEACLPARLSPSALLLSGAETAYECTREIAPDLDPLLRRRIMGS